MSSILTCTGFSVALALCGCVPTSQMARTHQSSYETAVRERETQLEDAYLRADTKSLESIYADDAVFVTPYGTVLQKNQEIESRASGSLRFESYHVDEIRVRIYGDAAIVNLTATIVGRNRFGSMNGQYRYTRVYVRRNASWQLVAGQSTRIQ